MIKQLRNTYSYYVTVVTYVTVTYYTRVRNFFLLQVLTLADFSHAASQPKKTIRLASRFVLANQISRASQPKCLYSQSNRRRGATRWSILMAHQQNLNICLP